MDRRSKAVGRKIILDLCGGSGSWTQDYANHPEEYDRRLITLPKFDVRLLKYPEGIYGIVAAPPCTHLAGSGARWWSQKGTQALLESLAVADACCRLILLCKPKFWALENPVGRLSRFYGQPKLYFHPYYFGDAYQKKTCLWGEFNEPKHHQVELPKDPKLRRPIFFMGRSKNRATMRAVTPRGFARAFFEANR